MNLEQKPIEVPALLDIKALREQYELLEKLLNDITAVKDMQYYKKILICLNAYEVSIKQNEQLQSIIKEIADREKRAKESQEDS